ncbi:MAG: FprA family A-type flavoprotein [Nanobdellota archaeon]
MSEQISKRLHWIGVNNPEGRDFHGISTPRGGSYNSYLLSDEYPTLIDGTHQRFLDGYLESLKEVMNPQGIKYIVINHAEPDHSGALNELVSLTGATIVCTEKCRELLEAMGISAEFRTVGNNEEMSIGSLTLRFIMDPMVHWPETMMTSVPEEKVLFSGDLYGTEIAHEALFADEMEDFSELSRDYFALVMRPLHMSVKQAIKRTRELELELLCPSHGPCHRDLRIIDYYERMCTSPEEDKVLIMYASIWGSSKRMAEQLAAGVRAEGMEACVRDICKTNMVSLMAEALTSKGLMLGSLTMLGMYHPLYETVFAFLKLNNQHKKAFVFGTYGWSSAACRGLTQKLSELRYEIVGERDLRFGRPEEEKQLVEDGRQFAIKLKEG